MAFLTCEPNATVDAVHPKAMPAMLAPESFDHWLDSDREDACTLVRPHADEAMQIVA